MSEEYYTDFMLLQYHLTEYQKELIKAGLYEPEDFEEINEILLVNDDKEEENKLILKR